MLAYRPMIPVKWYSGCRLTRIVTYFQTRLQLRLVLMLPPVITTYPSLGYPVLYLPGFTRDGRPPTAGTVAEPTAGFYLTSGVYEGYIYMPTSCTDPSAYHFKFTSAPDWNHINYGNGGIADSLTTDGNAGDFVLPGPGLYELSANTTTFHYTATPITWAIIGDATPNGWSAETEMTFNPGSMTWSITLPMVTTGSFKFRANNAWNIDFGISMQQTTGYIMLITRYSVAAVLNRA